MFEKVYQTLDHSSVRVLVAGTRAQSILPDPLLETMYIFSDLSPLGIGDKVVHDMVDTGP
jgi:hypothetical protein